MVSRDYSSILKYWYGYFVLNGLLFILVDVLNKRQKQSVSLKQCTDRAQVMNERELADLRSDIKVR